MSKPVLGLLLGAILGLIDGASAYLYPYPDVKAQIVAIMIGSMFKGLVTGLSTGYFATKLKSLPLGMLVGLVIGLLLSWGVVAMQPPGHQYYPEIMIPGALLGAVVGYATWRFGRCARQDRRLLEVPEPAVPRRTTLNEERRPRGFLYRSILPAFDKESHHGDAQAAARARQAELPHRQVGG